jgi:excisionase family DNA binding protein
MNKNTSPPSGIERPQPFLSKRQVSRRLKIRLRTLDDWMRRRLLPYYKLGRAVRFKWSEIELHFATTCRVCPRSRCLVKRTTAD